MKRLLFLSVAVLMLVTGSVLAELHIVGELKVPTNRLVRLKAEGVPKGAALVWDISDEDRIDIEEYGGRLLFAGPAGTYKVKLRSVSLAGGATQIETTRATVVIGDPMPPVPPVPPTPPVPVDPLAQTLQAIYRGDATPDKATHLASLAELYRQTIGKVDDPAIRTSGDLVGILKHASEGLLPALAIKPVRDRIAVELKLVIPSAPDAVLDATTRSAIKILFDRISKALVEAGK